MTITRDADGEAYHHGLQCSVRSASYSFRERRGRLDMETLCGCDMSGCIAFFEAIDPEVEEIEERRRGKKERPPEGGPSPSQILLG